MEEVAVMVLKKPQVLMNTIVGVTDLKNTCRVSMEYIKY